MELKTLTIDQLLYSAILIWARDNKPYEIPEGGYVIDIKSARESYLGWLNVMGREEFIIKTGIDRFFGNKKPKIKSLSKADKLAELSELVTTLGFDIKDAGSLTGLAASYFSGILKCAMNS